MFHQVRSILSFGWFTFSSAENTRFRNQQLPESGCPVGTSSSSEASNSDSIFDRSFPGSVSRVSSSSSCDPSSHQVESTNKFTYITNEIIGNIRKIVSKIICRINLCMKIARKISSLFCNLQISRQILLEYIHCIREED